MVDFASKIGNNPAAAGFGAFSNEPPEMSLPWGKHRGEPLSAVETGYLEWVLRSADKCDPTLRAAIEQELAARKTKAPATVTDRHSVPSQYDELTMDLARLIVELGVEAAREMCGTDYRFGAATEFLRQKIDMEVVNDGTLAF